MDASYSGQTRGRCSSWSTHILSNDMTWTGDRRIQRTEKLLHGALATLIREEPYDAIAVKEILDRANVGRSAFYTHFRDKDELLVSAFHDILGVVPSARPQPSDSRKERLLWFSLPVFEHLDQLRHAGELKLGPRGRTVLHGHL